MRKRGVNCRRSRRRATAERPEPTDGLTSRSVGCCSLIKRRSDAGLSHRYRFRRLPQHTLALCITQSILDTPRKYGRF
jgi:hypothetical protein